MSTLKLESCCLREFASLEESHFPDYVSCFTLGTGAKKKKKDLISCALIRLRYYVRQIVGYVVLIISSSLSHLLQSSTRLLFFPPIFHGSKSHVVVGVLHALVVISSALKGH